MPRQAVTDQEIANCFPVISELRPHLSAQDFIIRIRQMENEGYKLAFISENEVVVAVAGYRILTNLFMGKNLYVDDLVTSSQHRSNGYGKKLLDWLQKVAETQNCKILHLDSGTQRHQAHKFYFRHGLITTSFHFVKKLAPPSPKD